MPYTHLWNDSRTASEESPEILRGKRSYGVFLDCFATYDHKKEVAFAKKENPFNFQGTEPARFCWTPVDMDGQVVDSAYLFFTIPWFEQVQVMELDYAFSTGGDPVAMLRSGLPEELILPLVGEIVTHEIRHEAQAFEAITLRDFSFNHPEFVSIASEVKAAWSKHLPRIVSVYNGEQAMIRAELDAIITGRTLGAIWKRVETEKERLDVTKELVLG
ncbi:MAG: hypothetical protein PHV93_02075 [Candidatus Pacebacteria bacterium]|nr:hypothetical protein [Candidatus Paceibacterota bacterium]